MALYEILITAIGSAVVIFITLWVVTLVWEAFFSDRKTAKETLLTNIFEELTLRVTDWLIL